MTSLYAGAVGLIAFVLAAITLGFRLRRHPSRRAAEKYSRTMHFLFFAGLGAPFLMAIIHPGLTRLDPLIGLDPLPARPLFVAAGVILGIPGIYLLGISNRLLRALGSGANAFRLTQRVVTADAYRRTRNPMSLGYYLSCVSLAFLSGSSLLTGYVLVGVIPAHLFFLKFFEERELELRLGASYADYKQAVPFLLPRLSSR